MPHTDTPGAQTPDPAAETMDTAAAQRVEQEKLTRRAALRKLGFGAGIAAFSLLGVDDFARMVGQRLQRNAHDNKTALAVAKEFQSAGIALADNPSNAGCQASLDKKNRDLIQEYKDFNKCQDDCVRNDPHDPSDPFVGQTPCMKLCATTYTNKSSATRLEFAADCVTLGCNCNLPD